MCASGTSAMGRSSGRSLVGFCQARRPLLSFVTRSIASENTPSTPGSMASPARCSSTPSLTRPMRKSSPIPFAVALPAPADEADAERKLTELLAFVDKARIRADEIGVKRPLRGYAPYFLSVFWEAEGGRRGRSTIRPRGRCSLRTVSFPKRADSPERYLSFRGQMLRSQRRAGHGRLRLQHFLWQLNQEATDDGEGEAHPMRRPPCTLSSSGRRAATRTRLSYTAKSRTNTARSGGVSPRPPTTTGGSRKQWLERLRNQIAAGAPTHVFLVGETCWKTDLRAVTYSRDETDEALIPPYYADQEPTSTTSGFNWRTSRRPTATHSLRELDPEREQKRGKPVALGNQTNPLFVRLRTEPRTWWVNQGRSYSRAREGGYLWAPLRDKVGNPKAHWETMRHLRAGDVVLNYANTRLRARSEVIARRCSVRAPRSRRRPRLGRGRTASRGPISASFRSQSPSRRSPSSGAALKEGRSRATEPSSRATSSRSRTPSPRNSEGHSRSSSSESDGGRQRFTATSSGREDP